MKTSRLPLLLALLTLAVLALAIAHYTGDLVIWEDGSFRLFNLTGCFPLQPCR